VATGDFNGDGLPDLVATDYFFNGVFVLTNDGAWNNPAPRAGRAAKASLAALASAPLPFPAPQATGNDPRDDFALPPNPLPPRSLRTPFVEASTRSAVASPPPSLGKSQAMTDAEGELGSWALWDSIECYGLRITQMVPCNLGNVSVPWDPHANDR
jgi:hypothetical protein